MAPEPLTGSALQPLRNAAGGGLGAKQKHVFTFSQPMFSLLTHRKKLEIIGCIFCLILHMCDSQRRKTNTSNEDCKMNFRM